jgi:hypothetical protein
MSVTFKQLTDFFIESGADGVSHSEKTYLAHAIGVYNDLKTWGYDEEFARTGLFHSIYGTQIFQGFTLPEDRRDEIRGLIGEYAEHLCYLNCLMLRPSLYGQLSDDKESYPIEHRVTGEMMETDRKTFDDLCSLHLCDWLEQVERAERFNFQREEFHNIAKRLGGIAEESYDRVFAKEQVA